MRDCSDCTTRHAAVTNVPFPSRARIAICDAAAASVVTKRERRVESEGRHASVFVTLGKKVVCANHGRGGRTIRFNDKVHDAHAEQSDEDSGLS